jgi:hypothetical protein
MWMLWFETATNCASHIRSDQKTLENCLHKTNCQGPLFGAATVTTSGRVASPPPPPSLVSMFDPPSPETDATTPSPTASPRSPQMPSAAKLLAGSYADAAARRKNSTPVSLSPTGTMHTTPCTQCTQCQAHKAMHTIPCTQCHAHNVMHTTPCTQCHAHNARHTIPCTQCHSPNASLFTPNKPDNLHQ